MNHIDSFCEGGVSVCVFVRHLPRFLPTVCTNGGVRMFVSVCMYLTNPAAAVDTLVRHHLLSISGSTSALHSLPAILAGLLGIYCRNGQGPRDATKHSLTVPWGPALLSYHSIYPCLEGIVSAGGWETTGGSKLSFVRWECLKIEILLNTILCLLYITFFG